MKMARPVNVKQQGKIMPLVLLLEQKFLTLLHFNCS